AMNAAYFVSGQITMGTSVYYQNLVGDRFVRISRFPNIMDLDYLFNGWILGEKPLNLDLLSKSKTELCICTTKMSDGTPRYFGNRGPELRSVIPALKASCSTPLFTRNVESIDGELYGDGLINDAIPLDRALDAGCTDLVLLLTRTSGYKKSIGFTERLLGWLQTRHLSNAYRAMFLTQGTRYNALLDRISAGQVSCESLLVLRPTQEGMIQNGEARPDRVRHAARCGLSVVARTFKSSPDKLRLYDEVAIGS
ncbi:MAG TPA: hypothetical protein VKE92_03515, partial [Anaerolineales bacterium]|nr:hypothetical protein [Anaerolineales bacterium]